MSRSSFTLRQLEYFVAVAEAGTLSAAAERLHVSQPGLSQALTDLERALDARLTIRRKARGVSLTASGLLVLRQAREILRVTEEMERVASDRTTLTGVLSLGCFVTLAPTVLPGLIEEFERLHPEVSVTFVEGDQQQLHDRLVHGDIDLAIVYDLEVSRGVDRCEIGAMRPYILLAADHPLAERTSVRLAELAHEPMVLPAVPPGQENTLRIFEQFGIQPNVKYRPSTMELARSLVGRGMGYAFFVQHTASDLTYEGNPVVTVEIEDPVGEVDVLLTWLKDVRLNRRAQAFVKFCAERRVDALEPGRSNVTE